MKIICIGRNYAEHAKELNNAVPDKPVIFMKPSTAMVINDKPFYFPDYTQNLHHEGEIVLRISRNGRSVAEKFAADYFEEVTIGIDFTARDLQEQLKAKGQPWEIAKAFDNSAPVGKFIPKAQAFGPDGNILFSLHKNGQPVQNGNTGDLIFGFDYIISYVSKFFTLHKGDLIFTGTPAGVGPVAIGDVLEGYIGDQKLLHTAVK